MKQFAFRQRSVVPGLEVVIQYIIRSGDDVSVAKKYYRWVGVKQWRVSQWVATTTKEKIDGWQESLEGMDGC